MSNKAFDDKLRRLENESSMSAPSFVWDNIESTLDKKKGNKWMWLIRGLVILCTALGTSWLLETTTTHKDISSETTITNVKTKIIEANHIAIQKSSSNKTTALNKPTPSQDQAPEMSFPNKELGSRVLAEKQLSTPLVTTKRQNLENPSGSAPHFVKTTEINNKTILSNALPAFPILKHYLIRKQVIHFPLSKPTVEPVSLSLLNAEQSVKDRTKKSTIQSFIEAGGIVGHHQQQFGSLTDLTRLRESTESEWYSYGAFLRYSAKLSTNWYASLGYQHTTHKDKFYLEQQNAICFNVINAEDTLNGPDTSFTTGTYISQGEIKHKSFDFTLSTSFVKAIGNWELGGEVTAIYNYNQKSTGKTLALNGSETRLENEGYNTYKTSLGLGYQLGGVINYTINNRYSLSLRPFYKSYFGDWNTASSVETFRINSYGIQLGTRLAF